MGTLTAVEDILLGILLGLSLFSVSYVIELGPHSRKKKKKKKKTNKKI
jgi:hypothetical protein